MVKCGRLHVLCTLPKFTVIHSTVCSYEALRHLPYRGLKSPDSPTHSMNAVMKEWLLANPKQSDNLALCHSPATPLRLNPMLSEFLTILDPSIWAVKGIKTLENICEGATLNSFEWLKLQFNLPNAYLFRYPELQHYIYY